MAERDKQDCMWTAPEPVKLNSNENKAASQIVTSVIRKN